ncbi:MAG: hypothetical protein NC299_16585 [Lachnospiraceae bacterium]|nr:hypothetical protein [Ruminococcus sp.]MCM1276954.1 hypothetical protein [Lachnospiraceae bacterium]
MSKNCKNEGKANMEVIKKGKIPAGKTDDGNTKPTTLSVKLTAEENRKFTEDYERSGMRTKSDYARHLMFNADRIITIESGHEILIKLAECANLLTAIGEKISPANKTDFGEVRKQFGKIEEDISFALDCIDAINNNANDGKEVV